MAKGWTEERRRAQAERCRAAKPWNHATGPRTAEGKARSSMNAFKYGGRTGQIKMTRELLALNRAFLSAYQALLENEMKKHQWNQSITIPHPIKFIKTK